ncbi:hypothetical protein EYF80_015657 [Liparis tanakae]|uniref:Uncharacterized protein n=1 Tax=Liparis tanakae TaxID=230148 RepID=A0A4Z2I9Y4_9TELE|nr:hypothetical protein EYF80_015657 [Liparis tanakae]
MAAPPASPISKSPTSELGTVLPPRPENRRRKASNEAPQSAEESDSEMDLGDVAVTRAKHSERQKKTTTKRNKVNKIPYCPCCSTASRCPSQNQGSGASQNQASGAPQTKIYANSTTMKQ